MPEKQVSTGRRRPTHVWSAATATHLGQVISEACSEHCCPSVKSSPTEHCCSNQEQLERQSAASVNPVVWGYAGEKPNAQMSRGWCDVALSNMALHAGNLQGCMLCKTSGSCNCSCQCSTTNPGTRLGLLPGAAVRRQWPPHKLTCKQIPASVKHASIISQI